MTVFCFFEDWVITSQEWFVTSYWVASPRTVAMTCFKHYDTPSQQIPLLVGLLKASFQPLEKPEMPTLKKSLVMWKPSEKSFIKEV